MFGVTCKARISKLCLENYLIIRSKIINKIKKEKKGKKRFKNIFAAIQLEF